MGAMTGSNRLPPLLLTACAVVPAAWLLLAGAAPAEPTVQTWEPVTFQGEAMATRWVVTLPEGDGAAEAVDAVFAIFADVDARMSEWKDGSPLSNVNRNAGVTPVPVPSDLRALIARGVRIGALTDGAFDITWAALWGLWDFRAEPPVVPDRAEAERRAALVDYRRIEIDDEAGTVLLGEPGMKLGLGGIAKGWALDRAAAELRRRGYDRFLMSGGGQVTVGGQRPLGGPWRVGVRDPRAGADQPFAMLAVQDASVSTSGDYERFFISGGVRYHHILDPRTGFPARGLRSVTTVSTDGTLADAMSTAIFVLGQERGLAIAEQTDDLEAVLVDSSGRVSRTSGVTDDRFVRLEELVLSED